MAAWTGISGERYYGFDEGGPDFTKMEQNWIRENVQIDPLSNAYTDNTNMLEGASPTFCTSYKMV
jgi:hypothetical protein